VIDVTREEARRIAVRAQLLDGSAKNVLDTVRRLGFLQIDAVAPVARPQHLVLGRPDEGIPLEELLPGEQPLDSRGS